MNKPNMLCALAACLLAWVSPSSCASLGGAYSPSAAEQEIFVAVLQNNLPKTEELLKAGSPPNARGVSGDSLLHTATYAGNDDMVRLLLKYQSDINFSNRDDLTPLYLAKKPYMVKLLLDHGADTRHVSKLKNVSPFESWCGSFGLVTSEADKKQVMDIMKSQNLPFNRAEFEKKQWILRSDLVETVKLYQASGYDINQSLNPHQQVPLVIAAQADNYTLIDILLAAGARADLRDKYHNDALGLIVRNPQSKNSNDAFAVTLAGLVKAGAEINGQDNYGNTPLCSAAIIGQLYRVKALLALKGIKVDAPGEYGESALAKTNVLGVAKALVGAGADIEHLGTAGNTPLFTILNVEVVDYLIKLKAKVNFINPRGDNILTHNMLAALGEYKVNADAAALDKKYLKKFERLIAAGINVNHPASAGTTALALAERIGMEQVTALLKKSGAK